jgi:hypothetical protein
MKKPLGRTRRRWEDGIKMDLRKRNVGVWTESNWIGIRTNIGLLRTRKWALGAHKTTQLTFLKKWERNVLTRLATISFRKWHYPMELLSLCMTNFYNSLTRHEGVWRKLNNDSWIFNHSTRWSVISFVLWPPLPHGKGTRGSRCMAPEPVYWICLCRKSNPGRPVIIGSHYCWANPSHF